MFYLFPSQHKCELYIAEESGRHLLRRITFVEFIADKIKESGIEETKLITWLSNEEAEIIYKGDKEAFQEDYERFCEHNKRLSIDSIKNHLTSLCVPFIYNNQYRIFQGWHAGLNDRMAENIYNHIIDCQEHEGDRG